MPTRAGAVVGVVGYAPAHAVADARKFKIGSDNLVPGRPLDIPSSTKHRSGAPSLIDRRERENTVRNSYRFSGAAPEESSRTSWPKMTPASRPVLSIVSKIIQLAARLLEPWQAITEKSSDFQRARC